MLFKAILSTVYLKQIPNLDLKAYIFIGEVKMQARFERFLASYYAVLTVFSLQLTLHSRNMIKTAAQIDFGERLDDTLHRQKNIDLGFIIGSYI